MTNKTIISKQSNQIVEMCVGTEKICTKSSVIIIQANIKNIIKIERVGFDVLIMLQSGETILIEDFFKDANFNTDQKLVIETDSQELLWVQFTDQQGQPLSQVAYSNINTDSESAFFGESSVLKWVGIPTALLGIYALVEEIDKGGNDDIDQAQPAETQVLENPATVAVDPDTNTTSSPQSEMSGTGTPGNTITIYDQGQQIAEITVAEDGTWSYTPDTPLGEGEHQISYTETASSTVNSEPLLSSADDVLWLSASGSQHTALIYELLADDASGGNGTDTVYDFVVGDYSSVVDSDLIDVQDLLIDYQKDSDGAAHNIDGTATIDVGDNIEQYLKLVDDGEDSVLQIDRDGSGSTYQFADLVVLKDVQTDLATLLANEQIIIG